MGVDIYSLYCFDEEGNLCAGVHHSTKESYKSLVDELSSEGYHVKVFDCDGVCIYTQEAQP